MSDRPLGSYLIIIGGALAVLGSFLPWASLVTGFGEVSKSGMDGGDGIFSLGIGVIAVLCGVSSLSSSSVPARNGAVICGIALILLGVFEYQHVSDLGDGSDSFVQIEVGAGVWTLFAAAAALLTGGLRPDLHPTVATTVWGNSQKSQKSPTTRPCPHCGEEFYPAEPVCPDCGKAVEPWELRNDGLWWVRRESGDYYLDPTTRQWMLKQRIPEPPS